MYESKIMRIRSKSSDTSTERSSNITSARSVDSINRDADRILDYAFNTAAQSSQTGLADVLADLSEISLHIEELRNPTVASELRREHLEAELAQLEKLKHRHLHLLKKGLRWGNHIDILIDDCRRDYLTMKARLRVLWRRRGLDHCENDWQSPIYASTLAGDQNRLTEGIKEHCLDYKRDGHLDSRSYEKAFISEYCSHLGGSPEAYLANSGMAAFTTVLHFLAHEMKLQDCLAVEPMYFENLHLAGCYFPDLQRRKYIDVEHLRLTNPQVVLVDAVTNCGEVLRHDLESLFNWAAERENKVAVVIDSTCLPTLLLEKDLFAVPENVLIFLVESLAKHHQLGMDAVTGGIVIAQLPKQAQENFQKTRARAGTNISDSSVHSLPPPRREMLSKRLARHSRNTAFLASKLKDVGAIEAVSSLSVSSDGTQNPQARDNQFHGTCLTLHLRPEFRSLQSYQAFEKKVMELAAMKSHPLALSTSFGFDVSRLYVTAPATPFEEPFLRIAVGTETAPQIEMLTQILKEAGNLHLPSNSASPLKDSAAGESAQFKPSRQAQAGASRVKHLSPPGAFIGEDSLDRYLSPEFFAPSPLVELPEDLNPLRADGVRLTAKMMSLVPLMNIKSLPAYAMLKNAHERDELAGVGSLIESSSSNTVLSLSILGKLFGIESTSAIVDHSIAPSLVRMLQLFGIDILLHPGPGHPLYEQVEPRSKRAASLGSRTGWINPGQYTNADNPDGFERWLAPEIWTQSGGRIDMLVCALGTCGTMVGVSRGLQKRNPALQVVACCPRKGEAVPGPREKEQLSDVTFPWQERAQVLELGAKESFAASIRLLRRGIMAGPSSGMNYAGALQHLNTLKENGRLAELKAEKGEVWCTFLCCDSPLPHVDEYFDALGKDYFPEAKQYEP